jgi:glycosyltransferase involved in cell wall biosynthesis
MTKNISIKDKFLIARANELFRNKSYEAALAVYEEVLWYSPLFYKIISVNIEITKDRLGLASLTDRHKSKFLKPKSLAKYFFDIIEESGLFDVIWYLNEYGSKYIIDINPLEHYLLNSIENRLNPSQSFDTHYYIESNPDLLNSELHPFIHYVVRGKKEGRQPLPLTLVADYYSKFPVAEIKYYPRLSDISPLVKKTVRVIAFYLPQFHPIPENNRWWGEGFTEWTNVKPAQPQFERHYQPHVPDEYLGYYNLLDQNIQVKQIELAKQYGIEGFCFYLYWFTGKKLLEKPLDNYLSDSSLDLPFCVCWANENWSRRWDGLDQDILIEQHYSPEDDINFIENVSKYLRDPRYIRINDKPLLLVYRPKLFPDIKATVMRWRNWCEVNGIGEIYLTYPQSFESVNPEIYGFDAAVEFPPNNSSPPDITDKIKTVSDVFESKVYDWRVFVDRSEQYQDPGYKLFRSVNPGWDNTARKKNKGTVFHNSCPLLFKQWLINAISDTYKRIDNPDERCIFVNAWNEWGEGAHLEPDQRYGYAWLEAIYRAHESISMLGCKEIVKTSFLVKDLRVTKSLASQTQGTDILFVSHDAHNGGAQHSLLSIVNFFKSSTFFNIKVLLLGGGANVEKFEDICQVSILNIKSIKDANPGDINRRIEEFCEGKPSILYCNTIASGVLLKFIEKNDYKVISHVRELQSSIIRYGGDWIPDVIKKTDMFIACSQAVSNLLVSEFQILTDDVKVVYTSLDSYRLVDSKKLLIDSKYKTSISNDPNLKLVLGCGIGMPFRKGADLFVETFLNFKKTTKKRVHFRWIGSFSETEKDASGISWGEYLKRIDNRQDDLVTFDMIPFQSDVFYHFSQADIYLLTSREEPLGRTALEAASVGLLVLGFSGAGGISEILANTPELLIDNFSPMQMAEKVDYFLEHSKCRADFSHRLYNEVKVKYTTATNFPKIITHINSIIKRKPTVSIIIPNFNYAHYLDERVSCILNQTFQDFEIILLDDASTDDSKDVIERIASQDHRITVHYNKFNSGSPYPQWFKGISLARADLIWIAEADDLSEITFLEELLPYFRYPDVRFAYCASKTINATGQVGSDYRMQPYLKDISSDRWKENYIINADEEVNAAIGIKNTVLNISSSIFRKFELPELDKSKIESMIMAGDWLFILNCIRGGSVAFHSNLLNSHRRHQASAIHRELSNVYLDNLFSTRKMIHDYVRVNFIVTLDFEEKVASYVIKLAKEHAGEDWRKILSTYYPNLVLYEEKIEIKV